MPFSQFHIPFSGREFRQADFIAEGLDQTRGWFYTLTVLSTLLGHPSPFKNLIVNGLILAEDGKKMSKSLRNYPDPEKIMDEIGADSVRLYLVNSPASHAEPLCFKQKEVEQIVRSTMLPWMNSLKFWIEQVIRHGNDFHRDQNLAYSSTNVLDQWILSKTQRLVQFVHSEMKQYHLYTVLPELVKFIADLNNWYVRLNRIRMKKGSDAKTGLAVLFEILLTLDLLMAPFAPFFAEYVYLKLKPALSPEESKDSVHFVMLPQEVESLIHKDIENRVERMQSAIQIARLVRDRQKIPIRRPMRELVIVCSEIVKQQIEDLSHYIQSDVNVISVNFETDEKRFVKFSAQPDNRALGRKLGKKLKDVTNALVNLPYDQMEELYERSIQCKLENKPAPEFVVEGISLNTDEVVISRELIIPDPTKYDGGVDGQVVAFANYIPDAEILQLNIAREIRSRVQLSRKELGCVPTDKVKIYMNFDNNNYMDKNGIWYHSDNSKVNEEELELLIKSIKEETESSQLFPSGLKLDKNNKFIFPSGYISSREEILEVLNSKSSIILEALEFNINLGKPLENENLFGNTPYLDKLNNLEFYLVNAQ